MRTIKNSTKISTSVKRKKVKKSGPQSLGQTIMLYSYFAKAPVAVRILTSCSKWNMMLCKAKLKRKYEVGGYIVERCEWCNLSEEDKKYLLSDTKYWTVYLADEQDYIGRCIIVL